MTRRRDSDPQLPGFGLEATSRQIEPSPTPVPVGASAEPLTVEPLTVEPFIVEVVRSGRRRRTVGAQMVGPVLRLAIPSWMSAAEESHWVDEMSTRFRRRLSTDRIDLSARAITLARRLDLSRPREVRWADDMTARWGSCTPSTSTIRISTRIAPFPDWVIDYVLVHEIAHLDVAGHGDDFWRIVHRYSRSERAIGYLIAKSGEPD